MLMSMRKSILKSSGVTRPGRALDNLWSVARWDGAGVSRARSGHICHKDIKSFNKPWQRNPRPDAVVHCADRDIVIEAIPTLEILVAGKGFIDINQI